jgi:hypothetical protein
MSWALDCSIACRCLLGLVFGVSVVSKVRSREAWRALGTWLAGMPFRPLRLRGMPLALVLAEAAVVALVAAAPLAGLILGAGLALALTAGLYLVVRSGSGQPCLCFGTSSEPAGSQHVLRNGVLAALAVAGSVCAGTATGQPPGPAESMLAAIAGLAAALLVIFSGDVFALFGAGAELRPGAGHLAAAVTRGAATR